MFDSPCQYAFVQKEKNKNDSESYLFKHIYKFFLITLFSQRKYLVIIKEYQNKLFTIDFYAKVNNNTRNKYKTKTNQFHAGRVGKTVLMIMADFVNKTPGISFGILAATSFEEKDDAINKRFRVYDRVLKRTINRNYHKVIVIQEKNHIFVIPNERLDEKNEIIQ